MGSEKARVNAEILKPDNRMIAFNKMKLHCSLA